MHHDGHHGGAHLPHAGHATSRHYTVDHEPSGKQSLDRWGSSGMPTYQSVERPRRRSSVSASVGVKAKWHAKGLWPPPKLLRTGGANDFDYEHERDMTWSELFFDLIFVVAIARLGEHARESSETNISLENGTYFIYFLCFFVMWMQSTIYGTRFGANDLPNVIYFGTYMLGCVFMTSNLRGGFEGDGFPKFALACVIPNVAEALVYIRINRNPPMDKNQKPSTNAANFAKIVGCLSVFRIFLCLLLSMTIDSWTHGLRIPLTIIFVLSYSTVFIVLLLLPCIYPGRAKPSPWYDQALFSCACARFVPGYPAGPNFLVPVHLEHFTERFGLFVIIFLGEVVDDITSKEESTGSFLEISVSVASAFLILLALKMLYFDTDSEEFGEDEEEFMEEEEKKKKELKEKLPEPDEWEELVEKLEDLVRETNEQRLIKKFEQVGLGDWAAGAWANEEDDGLSNHAMRRHRVSGILWMYLHIGLMLPTATLGCGLNVICSTVRLNGEMPEEIDSIAFVHRREYVTYSLAAFTISLVLIGHTHTHTGFRPLRKYKYLYQVVTSCVYLAIPSLVPEEMLPDPALLVLLAVNSVLLVAFNLAESHYYANDV